MAKTAVATYSKGSTRIVIKCIRMDNSPKSGAYMFKEELVPTEQVKDFFAKK